MPILSSLTRNAIEEPLDEMDIQANTIAEGRRRMLNNQQLQPFYMSNTL